MTTQYHRADYIKPDRAISRGEYESRVALEMSRDPKGTVTACQLCVRYLDVCVCRKGPPPIDPDNPPTDDAWITSLEPFGLATRLIESLDAAGLGTVGAVREWLRTREKIPGIDGSYSRVIAESLEKADAWLREQDEH